MWRNNYSAIQKKKFLAKKKIFGGLGIYFQSGRVFSWLPFFFLRA